MALLSLLDDELFVDDLSCPNAITPTNNTAAIVAI
jgi:hypothetical protein